MNVKLISSTNVNLIISRWSKIRVVNISGNIVPKTRANNKYGRIKLIYFFWSLVINKAKPNKIIGILY
jgi:hypothetical protein